MIKCFYKPLFIIALLTLLPFSLMAQAKKSDSSSDGQVVATDKSGNEAVCEGALELIPSGKATFVRKRYKAVAKTAQQNKSKLQSQKRK